MRIVHPFHEPPAPSPSDLRVVSYVLPGACAPNSALDVAYERVLLEADERGVGARNVSLPPQGVDRVAATVEAWLEARAEGGEGGMEGRAVKRQRVVVD